MELNDRDHIEICPDSLNIINRNKIQAPAETKWLLQGAIPMRYYTICYGEGGIGENEQKRRLDQLCKGLGLSSIPDNFFDAKPKKATKEVMTNAKE